MRWDVSGDRLLRTGGAIMSAKGLLLAGLLTTALLASGPGAWTADDAKARLRVRVSPRMALSPTQVLASAQLVGGDGSEEYYCPGLVWDWDDGSRSAHEADCAPYAPGIELERRFSARHVYRAPGEYTVRLTMQRAGRSVAVASARVSVRGPGGFESH
jgi:hypothetical protein